MSPIIFRNCFILHVIKCYSSHDHLNACSHDELPMGYQINLLQPEIHENVWPIIMFKTRTHFTQISTYKVIFIVYLDLGMIQ